MAIGPFWVGDIPATPLRIDVFREDLPVELDAYTGVTATLLAPDGTVTENALPGTIDADSDEVVLTWPAVSVFTAPGIYALQVTLTSDSQWESLAPEYVVAQELDGWLTLENARARWVDAPDDDAVLFTLLETSKTQCIDYAPALLDAEGAALPVPVHYVQAQLMQSRNLWNASRTDPSSGGIGAEGFVVRPFPMDWVVKGVLRPKRGVPVIG